mmetsp:Transcript_12653/g.41711  ORF Transcript_12653/g.41711 Transcript_12653/m.41711 type:complete len:727 (-) Transcript_12653:102-2282(-)|eukprot:CAMPEP_0170139606 /NCGR_PEP_ID=MMETSP0033_2-20121228/5783_1 /TAXON_ID=195969 /ORGANISM="Dolichomastix tenuilepis, Strain CCMP3274" /LENGTH=726 /DNA_ID=CAMNT_0010375741 /DNA_START=136 /DNA_END=2316 /DNA_ORIENTATION=-
MMHNVLASIHRHSRDGDGDSPDDEPPQPSRAPSEPPNDGSPRARSPFAVVEGGVELEEAEGNEFHLAVVLRKYTSAKLAVSNGARVTRVEDSQLWDALGLLRSLQFDVEQFNVAAREPHSKAEVQYLCYRLMRQASSFGVRLPKAGEGLTAVRGLDALIAHIETCTHADALALARSTLSGGLVDFASLGELFTPGADLVDHGAATGLFGVPMAVRVRAGYYGRGKSLFGVVSTFYAACEFVVSVGDRYAVVESHQMIPEFQGTRSTTESLDGWVQVSESLKQRLIARGELYRRVSTSHVFVEHGSATFIPAPRAGRTEAASSSVSRARSAGRMMVDVSAAWLRGVHCAHTGGEACEAVQATLRLAAQRARASAGRHKARRDMEYYGGSQQAEEAGSLELLLLDELPASLLWRTWPTVAGFSFAAKAWGVAMVDGLRDVEFNDRAFAQLVLPPDRKRLIEALVLSHNDQGRQTADLIAGKGEGSIFLLHGPPGVGKTLTAEAIAEMLHRPLYVVSMGELGTTPEALESNLTDILELAAPWGALVLIDEAEMLLEKRTKSDIVRNAMVCVMLRLLEYHRGVLFLTSNRVEALDPAFQSRVQCALKYDHLSKDSRAHVWRNLLEARGLAEAVLDVEALAAHALNGRQIKNALQLALALARRDGVPLAQPHLEATVQLATAFEQDATGAVDEAADETALRRLRKLKEMLEAGLIETHEYDTKKKTIVEAI